jgi:limonene-1,2-epoxide hydrolase
VTAEEVVREWCAAWRTGDVEQLAAAFTDDAVFQNGAHDHVQVGRDEIRAGIERGFRMSPTIEFRVVHAAATDEDVVLVERIDVIFAGGEPVELPIVGVFELRGGKIARWRDYFDRADFRRRLGPAWTDEPVSG